MDAKHTNDKICFGIKCEICREKIATLFINLKNFMKRFVPTSKNNIC